MKRFNFIVLMLIASIMTFTFTACGGDDDNGNNSGGGNNGGNMSISIIGTWRAYHQSNDVQVYDLVTFNADHTGYIIEEVGNGTDYKNPITWTMTGNVITVKLDGDYVITWTILQVIDDNTVTISDGKRTYNVVRDGTVGGGNTPSNFVSKGGGSLTVAQLLGTWQAYQVEYYGVENGQVYNQSYEIYPNDQSKGMTTCYRYEFYADYTYKRTEYYNGDWIAPRNYSYRETGGRIYLPEGGSPAPEYCMVTANKTRSDEIVITTHYTSHDQYTEYLLKRVEGGETPSATFNIVGTWRAYYQSNDPSRGQVYDLVSFNADHTGSVIEEVGYGSDNSISLTWTLTGNVIQVKLDGDYVITWTIIQIIDDNTVIISDGKRNYNVVRDETGGGSTPVTTNPVLGTFSCVYQSYYDETPFDYYGGFVTIIEDPDNTSLKNAIIIKDLYLEGSAISGYYDLDQGMLYVEAWERIGNFVGNKQEYGFISLNWKDTDSDWIPFTINEDGSLTSDSFGVYALDADYANYLGWWEVATITTLTPTQSGSVRKMSAKISATTKKIKVNKVRLPNKRIRK